ncbi:MAG: hypothetical protein Ct9H90mP6_03380 [Gammaproteobacteria bacterium]|nr:MAG: hypothetical protein Ct9H90mP6_03380 [Gammaproteobacteria bacterium]
MKEKIMHGSFQKQKPSNSYLNDINKPKNIEKIVCSTQHAEDVDIEYVRKKIEEIIRDEIKEDFKLYRVSY